MFDNNSIIIWLEVVYNLSDPTLPRSVRSCATSWNMKHYMIESIRHIVSKWVIMTLGGGHLIAINPPKIYIIPKCQDTQFANIGT